MLNLRSIGKDYVTSSETVHALKGVSISFRKTEFVSVLGPSGCGKTTLLNIIGGLDHYTDGDLMIGSRSTKEYTDKDWDVYRNHRIGFIFQSYNLIPHQTVLANVELALTIAGIDKEERVRRAKIALDRVGLSGQYNKKPNQLSGGQCQRVAIARALVNDPEILLADEPTGALDTVTSVQIMELIKEISNERLVIMVTHNPELAEQYSTRIVRLLDGEIIEDTNPMTEEEIEAELKAEEAERQASEEEAKALAEATKTAKDKIKSIGKKIKNKRQQKAKMSFFTAFMLSAKNLWSKRGRTALVGFAGSIGIFGIATVLAFSAGIKGYVASMQDDMLSGNPIMITQTAYDFDIVTDMMNDVLPVDEIREEHKVYIDSLIEYIAKMDKYSNSFFIKNTISQQYTDYVKAMPKEYYNAMTFNYGIDPTYSIFTNFVHSTPGGNTATSRISIAALTEMYTSVLKETEYGDYSNYITQLVPSFSQAPNDPDYIRSQYDVYGEVADEVDEVMLVLSKNQEISDVLLARLGIFTEAEFYNLVYKTATMSEPKEGEEVKPETELMKELYDPALDVEFFDYSELLSGKYTFTWYPNDTLFTKNSGMTSQLNPFSYHHDAKDIEDEGIDLKITGILIANENYHFGCLTPGIYYTEALTDHILETNANSEIVNYVKEKGGIPSFVSNGIPMGVYYKYTYRHFFPKTLDNGSTELFAETYGLLGGSFSIEDAMDSMADMMGGGSGSSGEGGSSGGSGSGNTGTSVNINALANMKTISLRMIGGDTVASSIKIYPLSFDSKDLVTQYLDKWNSDDVLNIGGVDYTHEERGNVKYNDTLELIISMINTMIDIISYALIAFTSVSLIVSTVMIGIITYVSVVERIKEIGVIRSLGGRKKDVRHLFNAETFIIGSLSGLIGIIATYGLSALLSAGLAPLINYSNIAFLRASDALLMVLLSIGLTLISGLIPASSAAKKDPVVALRTE
ncbi:MAG: ABC transporter ATP-binding protein/permease [Clostridia bacterium]|nr:ABC transporter ATP-binding protein/permease [Clostridia bacterium]